MKRRMRIGWWLVAAILIPQLAFAQWVSSTCNDQEQREFDGTTKTCTKTWQPNEEEAFYTCPGEALSFRKECGGDDGGGNDPVFPEG